MRSKTNIQADVGCHRVEIEALELRKMLSAGPLAVLAADGVDVARSSIALGSTTTRLVENLDRGVIAINRGGGSVYVGWRLLGLDAPDIAFNLYRTVGSGSAVKVNAAPITQTTDYLDTGVDTSAGVTYAVRPVINGVESAVEGSYQLSAGTTARPYHGISIQKPAGGTTPDGESYDYVANDTSVGDLDGDGDYEIILKWDPTNAKDNSQGGYTGNVYIDAYTLEGVQLWRIDLGRNIRAGAHYTQLAVWDFDADGRAEVMLKTAPGTLDGNGVPVLLSGDAPSDDYRNSSGYILSGSEYLSVFDGYTGAQRDTVAFEPARGSTSQWGDSYGNRVDRFTVGVGYFGNDGIASAVFGRGYYYAQSGSGQARNEIATYDFRDGELSLRWHFESGVNINNNLNSAYVGQGAHGMSVADVDGDGLDEIIYGAATIDHDGTGLYSTGLGHGDAFHVSDMDPSRPGLEVFMAHESPGSYQSNGRNAGAGLRDAATGELLLQIPSTNDVGRGMAADIDPNYPGYEMWATTNVGTRSVYNVNGEAIYNAGNISYNFGVWWDADPLRELLDGTTISKWRYDFSNPGRQNFDLDPNSSSTFPVGVSSNNGTKSTPALSADILGDWREEVIWRTNDSSALHIYSTVIAANSRMYTLMHDTQYREAIAWQNGAYNQPPHPSFFVGADMAPAPTPDVQYVVFDGDLPAGPLPTRVDIYQAEDVTYSGASFEDRWAGFVGRGYVNVDTVGYVEFANVDGGLGGLTNVRVRFAVGESSNPTRDGQFIVNGQTSPIFFDNTGTWDNWTELTLRVNLNPGTTNTIRFVADGDDLANIDQIAVEKHLLPDPWVSRDLEVASVGYAAWSDGVFDLIGTGAQGHLVYQPIDTTAQELLALVDPSELDGSLSGLMFRDGLSADGVFGGVFVDSGGVLQFHGRSGIGGNVAVTLGQATPSPVWLRLRFASGVIIGQSADPANMRWATVGRLITSKAVARSDALVLGMSVDAGSASAQARASFSQVQLRPLFGQRAPRNPGRHALVPAVPFFPRTSPATRIVGVFGPREREGDQGVLSGKSELRKGVEVIDRRKQVR